MKIALLTRNPKLYSHQRIIETAQARGHEIVPVDYLRCYMNITSRKPELRYMGEKLEGFDAVIPRIAASHTFYGLAVLRQFEMMGVFPLNESVAIGRSRDKLRSLQILARDGDLLGLSAAMQVGAEIALGAGALDGGNRLAVDDEDADVAPLRFLDEFLHQDGDVGTVERLDDRLR